MNFFCEILIKKQYRIFEKKIPELSEINTTNANIYLYLFIYEIKNYIHTDYIFKFMKLIIYLYNDFIPENYRNELLNIFCSCQNHFFALKKFLYLIKLKKAKLSNFETDLCLNSLDEINENNKIKIYEKINNIVYTFRFSDLNNIIINNLCHAPDFFSMPLPIKNPLTNVIFSKSELYNIYFKMKFHGFNMSHIFHLFFLSEFDLIRFKIDNVCVIREESIKIFVNNLSLNSKIDIIHEILYDFNYVSNNITTIDSKFPSKPLLEVFSLLIHPYFTFNYSLNPLLKNESRKMIIGFLKFFYNLNPTFGRKIIISKKRRNKINNDDLNYIDNGTHYYYFIDKFITKQTFY